MLASIDRVEPQDMVASAGFQHERPFAGIESLARLAAFHVRYRLDFQRHAFLLKVVELNRLPRATLNGRFRLHAHRTGNSRDAWRYAVKATGAKEEWFGGRLLIGVRDYDEEFREDDLRLFFQKRFETLCRGEGVTDHCPGDI